MPPVINVVAGVLIFTTQLRVEVVEDDLLKEEPIPEMAKVPFPLTVPEALIFAVFTETTLPDPIVKSPPVH